MEIFISDYDPDWPAQFEYIKAELAGDLTDQKIPFISIEHVGSTAVPDLPAKPILDILIAIASSDFNAPKLEQFKDALGWGNRQGGYHYIGNGGVQDRWSFKLPDKEPQRNVYVVAEDGLPLRNCLTLRNTLRKHKGLREEYAHLKIELAQRKYNNVMQYSTLKNPVIRKVLREAGWSEAEIDDKEGQSVKDWPREMEVLEAELQLPWWQCIKDRVCDFYRMCTGCFHSATVWFCSSRRLRLEYRVGQEDHHKEDFGRDSTEPSGDW